MIKKKEMVPSTSDCVVKTEEDSEEVEEDFEESTSGQMETEVEPDGNQEMKKRDSKEFDDPLFNFSGEFLQIMLSATLNLNAVQDIRNNRFSSLVVF